MKLDLSNVSIDAVRVTASKKNSGGAVCRIDLTATMTKKARKALGFATTDDAGNEREWPPAPEKAGKLAVSFDATMLNLKSKQGNTLGDPEELECKVSLADGFSWKFKDRKDETNTTVLFSFSARTADLDSALLAVSYKFSSSSGDNTGTLTYNKPGTGTAVDMSPDPNQGDLEESEAPAPTAAERKAARDAESEKKKALRKGISPVN